MGGREAMSDALTHRGIPIEPLRPAIVAFPMDEAGFIRVREEIDILQSRYGKTLREAFELVNSWHRGGITQDGWAFHETALHEVRRRMEGSYWVKERSGIRHAIDLALAQLPKIYPEWRYGQMIANVSMWARGPTADAIWEVEDEEFLRAIEEHLRSRSVTAGGAG